MSTSNPTQATQRTKPASASRSKVRPAVAADELADLNGLLAMAQVGLNARDEKTIKNRIIAGLFGLMLVSMTGNVVQYVYQPEPKLLGETSDGRIRPLPLLSEPMYSHKEILAWSQKCVEGAYRLSYVDWKTSLSNNTFCFSDSTRKGFSDSLQKIGVLRFLTQELQGNIYAKSMQPIMRSYAMNNKGYYEWVVDIPYTIYIDGRERGTLPVVMTMRIRRMSQTIREDGLWVESYRVVPAGQGR
ncbi:DotI/IcmL family type IV secretion protein [Pseudomonas sp. RP23018S]|uniref:DotI/IcmL family type IV secretion protein n=1 Tax=Pseudomonas sp. RP23018S TaxID=3096037 RepID=UPI002ACA88A7|nr:DotI/IcmL family type IV secretion protein [Pseudomonas sp. RP23018S]MDZ5605234.1 DotI/IcmL family type IV secretion protein [Pseudomonas sp. RP23018S]